MVTSWDDRAVEVEVPINIALVKYWGKRDENLIIPINNSLSLNIDEVFARTRVRCSCRIAADSVMINDSVMNLEEKKNRRFPKFFDYARSLIKKHKLGAESGDKSEAVCRFEVCSTTNFPVGAGLASSAAGFAAIAFAIGTMFRIPAEEVSRLARRGSGSACRSVFGGLVEWQAGCEPSGLDSVAVQVLPESFWPDLRCIIVVLEESEKDVGSSDGMRRSVQTSELLQYRSTAVVPERIRRLIHAYESRNFSEFGRVVMAESNQLHAVCMDSFPPLKYMSDASWQVIRVVDEFNAEDRIRAAYTFDAGPNACIFLEEKNVPVFLEQLCRQFVVAPEIVTSLSSSGDVRLSTLVAPPKSTFSVRNIIVSRVGGSPRVVG